jgi:hypothetical protein
MELSVLRFGFLKGKFWVVRSLVRRLLKKNEVRIK